MTEFKTFLSKYPIIIKSFGNSMYPLLLNGDVLSIKKIVFRGIKINDLLFLKKNKKYFTHRVIYKRENYVITKGDNNFLPDGRIYEKNILGTVFSVERDGEKFNPDDLYLIQSSFYISEILKIKKEFEKNKIQYVILKGLPLHLFYEGSHPRRIYADCDLLINKSKLSLCKRLLLKVGFKQIETSLSNTGKKIKNKETEITFVKKKGNFVISIDLHLEAVFLMTQMGATDSLYPEKLIQSFTSLLLNESREINISNNKLRILSPENLLLYLLLHLYHHNFIGPHRYDLIVKVIKKEKINYKDIADKINSFKLINYILPTLILLDKHYGTDLLIKLDLFLKVNQKKILQIKGLVSKVDLFSDEDRISAGIKRFKLNLLLSPNLFYKKYRIFLSPIIIYSIYWTLTKRLNSLKFKF